MIVLTAAALPIQATEHDWYNGLRAPDGSLCCNETDCHELAWSQVRQVVGRKNPMGGTLRQWMAPPFDCRRQAMQRFADAQTEFPVPSKKLPVLPKIFPVRLRREFDQKGQSIPTVRAAHQSQQRPESRKFPVFSLDNSELEVENGSLVTAPSAMGLLERSMTILYVATSKIFSAWAADVGLGKHVYKVGIAEGLAEEALRSLNDESCAGANDWRLLKTQTVDGTEETAMLERLAKKEKVVDPNYYPRLHGATGVFRVNVTNVANHLLVKRALAGEEEKVDKVKPGDIAAYLIQNALP